MDDEPQVIFDCGANIGFVSHQFNKRFPKAIIHAFEPNPEVYDSMNKLLANNHNIVKHNYGVGNTDGILEFNKNRNTGTSSFLTPNSFHQKHLAKSFEKIEVPIKTLDKFCVDFEIESITKFVK